MAKVQLRITPSLTGVVNASGPDWFILDKEMEDGATIGDLLADLAFSYTDFRKVVFDPEIRKVSDQVMVVINDNLLPGSEVTEARLNDGDCVILLPMYAGG